APRIGPPPRDQSVEEPFEADGVRDLSDELERASAGAELEKPRGPRVKGLLLVVGYAQHLRDDREGERQRDVRNQIDAPFPRRAIEQPARHLLDAPRHLFDPPWGEREVHQLAHPPLLAI